MLWMPNGLATNCAPALLLPLLCMQDHEAKLKALFDDSSVTTAVLWPGGRGL